MISHSLSRMRPLIVDGRGRPLSLSTVRTTMASRESASPIVARLLWKNASFGTFSHEPPRVRASALPSRDQESKGLRHCGCNGIAIRLSREFLRAIDRDMFLSRARTWESPETPCSLDRPCLAPSLAQIRCWMIGRHAHAVAGGGHSGLYHILCPSPPMSIGS